MSRTSSALLLVIVLLVGVIMGMVADRTTRTVAAQAAGAAGRTAAPTSGPAAPAATAPSAAAPMPATPVSTSPVPASYQGPRGRSAETEEAIYQELAKQYEQFLPVNRTFELVARAVSPAVVHIVARKPAFLRDDEATPRHYEETGSGVIVRAEKGKGLYVLTNNHVVEGAPAADVSIVLHDGRALKPARYWADTKADVAVLQLGRDDLPCARLGNSDEAAVGNWVLALGSPFGLTHSVSQGIISARGRHEDELQEDGVENQDFLQTDAAINPGNSGGPLVNMKGEVIGINTAIASNGGGSEGVGFSIPINLAKWIMRQLVASGKVSRGALGVRLHPEMRHVEAIELGLDRPRGAWVEAVSESSPAAEAGLRNNDVIVRFNGVDVVDLNHLINMVSMTPIGSSVDMVVLREKKELARKARIADQEALTLSPANGTERLASNGLLRRPPRPSAPTAPESASTQALGLELITLDRTSARRLGLADSARGVEIVRIEPYSPLAKHVKLFDVIQSVDDKPIRTADEAVLALGRRSGRGSYVLGILRPFDGTMQKRAIRVP